MLKLKELRFGMIGRFITPQCIRFNELGNLIQVDGENRNTGGSSGSAKTTVFNALDYLLGLNDIPTTVLQSRLTKEKMWVEGDFDWDGKPVTIARAAKLSIDINGQITVGSSVQSEAKLDEILGMPRDIFRKILHKRQKEGGFFLEFTPKKMYEFLTDALNLAAERKKLEKVETKLSELEKQKITRQSAISVLQSGLKATQESILSLGMPPIRDIHQTVILELKGRYDASTKRYSETQETQKQETQALEIQRPNVTVKQFDSSARTGYETRKSTLTSTLNSRIREESDRVNGVRTSISTLTLEQNRLQHQVSNAESAKSVAFDLAGQIKKIRDSICPTCEQSWVTDAAKAKEQEIQQKLIGNLPIINAGNAASARLILLAGELAALQEQLKPNEIQELDQIRAEIAGLEPLILAEKTKESQYMTEQNAANCSILQHFATLQSDLRRKQAVEIDQVRGQADVDRRAFEAAVAKLKAYDDALKRYESVMAQMKSKESEYLSNLDEEANQLQAVEEDLVLAEALKKGVKEFISCSFDDALESIGDAATKIIRCIPTMSSATIQFEGQKETKDGKVKEEVNAVISMDGDIGIPIKSLSGGERSSVDLAVDLAVIDFIESESSKGIDIFILDEPFTGLDTVSIEMALEVLKNSNSTKKLIVVDHNPEVKQMVSNRLVVVRDGNSSTITDQGVING